MLGSGSPPPPLLSSDAADCFFPFKSEGSLKQPSATVPSGLWVRLIWQVANGLFRHLGFTVAHAHAQTCMIPPPPHNRLNTLWPGRILALRPLPSRGIGGAEEEDAGGPGDAGAVADEETDEEGVSDDDAWDGTVGHDFKCTVCGVFHFNSRSQVWPPVALGNDGGRRRTCVTAGVWGCCRDRSEVYLLGYPPPPHPPPPDPPIFFVCWRSAADADGNPCKLHAVRSSRLFYMPCLVIR